VQLALGVSDRDVFPFLAHCDCAEQIAYRHSRHRRAERRSPLHGAGGRGIGLLNKLKEYERQEAGLDTVDANLASGSPPTSASGAGSGNPLLAELGLTTIRMPRTIPRRCPAAGVGRLDVTSRFRSRMRQRRELAVHRREAG